MSSKQPEETISSQDIFHGRIISLKVNTVRLPNGRQTTREIVEHPGAVVIIAANDRGQLAMVRQYRSAIHQETLEVPAGTREPPEPADACAKRELAEEMGVQATSWHHLLDFYSSPGFCTETLSVFVATNLSPTQGVPEEDESIRREWIDLARLQDMIAKGEIRDAKSIASILAYAQSIEPGDARWHG